MGTDRRRILLLRHGRTAWNAEHRFQGRTDVDLDAVGLEQAQSAAADIARLRPTAVLTSDARRAHKTAEVLAVLVGVEPVVDVRLREADIGAWEGLTRDEVRTSFPAEYDAWRDGGDVSRGGGERYADVATRAVPAVTERLAMLPADGLLVVVVHGGTARALIGDVLGLPPAYWGSISSIGHGRWSVLEELSSSRWRLEQHNVRPRRVRKEST
jgi:broad specificity phosphatase PhoE